MIDKIKALFEKELNKNFSDFKVTFEVDGELVERIFRVESEIIVDAVVEEVTEDGVIPVEDGIFILEDGSTINVVDSIITEVKEAVEEVPGDETPSEDTTDVVEEEMKKLESKFNSIKVELESKKLELKELRIEFESFKSGTDEIPTEIKVKKEKMSKDDLKRFFGK